MTFAEAVQELDALYATLPRVDCQRQCQEACGPILMSRVEWIRVQRHARGRRTTLRDVTCPMLMRGACFVYAVRPLICRLYGLVRRMRCPFGCEPERWMSDDEARTVLLAAQAISQQCFPGKAPHA